MPRSNKTVSARHNWLRARALPRLFTVWGTLAVASGLCLAPSILGQTSDRNAEPVATTLPATTTPPTLQEITRWVNELSDDSYAKRQEAAARLMAAGMPARDQLRKIVGSPDPETRAAARRLISLIDRSESRRRLEAFAADVEGKQGLTLPGWDQFQKIAGNSASARSLFVEMQQQEGPLFSAVFGASKRVPEDLWEARLARVSQMQLMGGDRTLAPSLGTCAALLFFASLPEMTVSDNAGMLVENLLERPPIREVLQGENAQPAIRKLVVDWLLHCPNKSQELLRRRLTYISAMNLEQGLALALDIVSGDPQYLQVQPLAKADAALIIGQLGKREHIDRLEPLLEDASVCLQAASPIPAQPLQTVQVRDVALVVMLHLTDQAPSDYGYFKAALQPTRTFNLQTLFRENDQQRADAIAKWREWRQAHPDAKNEKPASK